jgi:hypothetical protein
VKHNPLRNFYFGFQIELFSLNPENVGIFLTIACILLTASPVGGRGVAT